MRAAETTWSRWRILAQALALCAAVSAWIPNAYGSGRADLADIEPPMLEVFDSYHLRFGVTELPYFAELSGGGMSPGAKKMYFLGVRQVYYPPAADTLRFDSLCSIKVTNFCAFFEEAGQNFCPTVNKISIVASPYWDGNELQGPVYQFGPKPLKSKAKRVRLTFLATLIPWNSDRELDYKVMTVVLQKTASGWAILEHQFER